MRTLKVPFQIDSRGGLATVEDTISIISQQIADLLATAHFERIMRPYYGAGVPEFIFSPIRAALLATRASEIKAYLNGIVELANIVRVSISEVPGQGSTLLLDVRYTVLPSPQVFSVVQTVTGIVTDESFGGAVL